MSLKAFTLALLAVEVVSAGAAVLGAAAAVTVNSVLALASTAKRLSISPRFTETFNLISR